MKFSKAESKILLLISFVIYSCSPLQQPSKMPSIATDLPIATTPPSILLAESKQKGLFLLENMDSQSYYLSDSNGDGMIPLSIPTNIRGLAMSPDGRRIAYIANEDAVLYLLDIKSMVISKLVNSADFQPGIGLAWSPNSQDIAFSCRVQGTLGLSLCLVNTTNRENIQILVKSEILGALDILDGVISPAWSSDGRKIVFLSSNTLLSSSSGGKIVPTKDIWLFDFSTNSTKLIFPHDTKGISYIFEPSFLPEINAIMFSGRKGNFNTIFVYQVDSQNVLDITSTDDNFDLVNFVLSPDEKSFLVYIPMAENSAQNFVPTLYSFDGHLLEQLTPLSNFQVISWSAQQ